MQHIQDKDLDQLFKDTFADAEVVPSANLWTAIEQEISPKKKQRKLPLFWMAAASVTVLITVTFVFNRAEKIKLQGSDAVAVTPGANTAEVIDGPAEETTVHKVIFASVKPAEHKHITEKEAEQQAAQAPEQPVKAAEITQTFIASAEVPAQEKKIENKVIPQEPVEIVYAQAKPATSTSEVMNENDQVSHKGIRNVGDLVNFVVDKVDKREKKALRFKTDDDESSLIGINIGFLKFNSRKK